MAACRMNDIYQHIPVLLNETVSHLITVSDGIYVDATFGRGGHSRALLQQLSPQGRVIAFDKDPEAIRYAKEYFSHDKRFTIVHATFSEMERSLKTFNITNQVSGILFDLGVSSPQLDDAHRGFSFSKPGKLDMRMDTSQGQTALDWLAKVSETELAHVLWHYGEEKFSRRIARAIVKKRQETPILTTDQLSTIIKLATPKQSQTYDKHPATRSFQAIRIAINQELTELEQALHQALNVLSVGGRLAVISFHSLEDRIVKQFIKHHEKGEALLPRLPIKGNTFKAKLKSLGKPIKPNLNEIILNPRARSAILRITEKLS